MHAKYDWNIIMAKNKLISFDVKNALEKSVSNFAQAANIETIDALEQLRKAGVPFFERRVGEPTNLKELKSFFGNARSSKKEGISRAKGRNSGPKLMDLEMIVVPNGRRLKVMKWPLTVGQFKEFLGAKETSGDPYRFGIMSTSQDFRLNIETRSDGEVLRGISLDDANAYAEWRNSQSGQRRRVWVPNDNLFYEIRNIVGKRLLRGVNCLEWTSTPNGAYFILRSIFDLDLRSDLEPDQNGCQTVVRFVESAA